MTGISSNGPVAPRRILRSLDPQGVEHSRRAGVTPSPAGFRVLSDYQYRTGEGHRCGVFIFERGGRLAGLEVWSMDGLSTPTGLPAIEQLRPLTLAEP